METQENLENIGIGTKEAQQLTPKNVKIVQARIEEVGEKKNKKVVCSVKHPDREDTIDISSVKYEVKSSIKVSGLWLNLDEDGLIRKGSALALMLEKFGCSNIKELEGKDVPTSEDDKGYLCIKAY